VNLSSSHVTCSCRQGQPAWSSKDAHPRLLLSNPAVPCSVCLISPHMGVQRGLSEARMGGCFCWEAQVAPILMSHILTSVSPLIGILVLFP
jgi:hypothetical protein